MIDDFCQDRANSAGLTGTYKAWISDGITSAASRLTHNAGPYKRVDGQIVAYSWDDLITPKTGGIYLQNPININESGISEGDVFVWTNTRPNGEIISSVNHCDNWTEADFSLWASGGTTGETGSNWTVGTGKTCNGLGRLYCFEQ